MGSFLVLSLRERKRKEKLHGNECSIEVLPQIPTSLSLLWGMRVRTYMQAIVNLQKTPKDARAAIVIHAKIDAVMRCVMEELGVPIPVRIDHLGIGRCGR